MAERQADMAAHVETMRVRLGRQAVLCTRRWQRGDAVLLAPALAASHRALAPQSVQRELGD